MTLGRNLRFAALAFLLWSLAYNLTVPLLPLYARELGANALGVGAVGSAGALGALLLILPLSQLSDRAGRRTALLTGWALSAAGFLTMWLAHTWVALLPGVFLSTGAVAALPALNALALEELPPAQRSRRFARLYAAAPLGALCGSAVAGVLGSGYGLRATTLVAGVSVVGAALALLPIREARPAAEKACPRGQAGSPTGGMRVTTGTGATGLVMAVMAATGFMLLALPGSFIVPFLQDVGHRGLTAVGLFTAVLSAAQFGWSMLFSVWPRQSGRVMIGPAPGWISFPAATLAALAVCLAANALFGLLMAVIGGTAALPAVSTAATLAALVLRGSQFTLQSLGSALMGDVVAHGPGLTTRLTAFSAILGVGAAAAPVTGGWLYGLAPTCPFGLTGISAAVGAVALVLCVRTRRRLLTQTAAQAAE